MVRTAFDMRWLGDVTHAWQSLQNAMDSRALSSAEWKLKVDHPHLFPAFGCTWGGREVLVAVSALDVQEKRPWTWHAFIDGSDVAPKDADVYSVTKRLREELVARLTYDFEQTQQALEDLNDG